MSMKKAPWGESLGSLDFCGGNVRESNPFTTISICANGFEDYSQNVFK
jgi:hypothetical protein